MRAYLRWGLTAVADADGAARRPSSQGSVNAARAVDLHQGGGAGDAVGRQALGLLERRHAASQRGVEDVVRRGRRGSQHLSKLCAHGVHQRAVRAHRERHRVARRHAPEGGEVAAPGRGQHRQRHLRGRLAHQQRGVVVAEPGQHHVHRSILRVAQREHAGSSQQPQQREAAMRAEAAHLLLGRQRARVAVDQQQRPFGRQQAQGLVLVARRPAQQHVEVVHGAQARRGGRDRRRAGQSGRDRRGAARWRGPAKRHWRPTTRARRTRAAARRPACPSAPRPSPPRRPARRRRARAATSARAWPGLVARRAEYLAGGLVHDRPVHARLAGGVRAQQRAIAQQVDAARHAVRELVDAAQRAGVEGQRALEPGHGETVRDVLRRLLLRQRVEVVARDHALRQLLQLGPRQHAAQLRLPDQHDLQQLALAGLEVGQQPQLLQHVGATGSAPRR